MVPVDTKDLLACFASVGFRAEDNLNFVHLVFWVRAPDSGLELPTTFANSRTRRGWNNAASTRQLKYGQWARPSKQRKIREFEGWAKKAQKKLKFFIS